MTFKERSTLRARAMRMSGAAVLMIVLLAAVRGPAAAQPAARRPGMIVIADVSQEPTKQIKRFQPMADYLASSLGKFGIHTGEVQMAPDVRTISAWMRAGTVDLYFDSIYPAMVVNDEAGAIPILRRWKGGEAVYYSLLFARADSGLKRLTDLKGRMLGFEHAYSTTGYFLPMTMLLMAGLHPVEKARADAAVDMRDVGYIFTQDDYNTIQWVFSGRVASGATDNLSFTRKIPETTRASLVVLAKSPLIARHVVLARPNMDPALVEAIRSVLKGMDRASEGQAVLDAFEKTARFSDFQGKTELAWAEKMYRLFKARRDRAP